MSHPPVVAFIHPTPRVVRHRAAVVRKKQNACLPDPSHHQIEAAKRFLLALLGQQK